VAIVNGYCTLAQAKAALRIADNTDDTLLENAITSASRRIDGYCGRFFYQTASSVVAMNPYSLYLLTFPADVSSGTGLVIKTDTAGDGTYATTLVLNTDYILTPTDAALQSRPYRNAYIVGSETFPLPVLQAVPPIQVTALWGWAAVPADVEQACVLLSIRQFARLNAALGVVGFADMAITVRAVDPDVRDLLSPYVEFGIA